MKGHNLVRPEVDLSTGLWECAEAAELRVIVGKHLVKPKLRHVKSRGSREDHAGVLRKGAKGKVRAGERPETIRIYEIDW